MFDPLSTIFIALVFLLAGSVKGVVGLGLPTISIALLAASFELGAAMALLVVPSFVTNLWQALSGIHVRAVLRRTWLFLVSASLTIWFGALALSRVDLQLLSGLLGVLLIVYAVNGLRGFHLPLSSSWEPWAGLIFGTVNGVLTGLTGSFVVPGVMYLQAIGLTKDALIQAMGMLFAVSAITLAGALYRENIMSPALLTYSGAATIPALIGMVLGRRLRAGINEHQFKNMLFTALALIGAYLIINSLGFAT